MQSIHRRTPKLKCDFNKVALQLYWNIEIVRRRCSSVSLRNISRLPSDSSNQSLWEQINVEYISLLTLQSFLNQPLYDEKYLIYVHIASKLFWPIWNAASSLSISPQLDMISIVQKNVLNLLRGAYLAFICEQFS